MYLALAVAGTFATTVVSAAPTVLHSGDFYGYLAGVGSGRGVGFHADSSFSITSLGIYGDLISQSFDAVVFASTNGQDAGALLASSSAVVGGAGAQYYDINLNYSFNAGSYYTLLFRPTDGNGGWANAINYWNDSGLPTTIGPLTLIDGVEGYNAGDFSNFLHPDLRINADVTPVPEPETYAMMLAGLGLLGLAQRRRKQKLSA
jgi:hypothetical protein